MFTAPFTAIPGEIITAAGWNVSARDNLSYIWSVLGGDPSTNNLALISIGPGSSQWIKIPDVALFDQKVSQKSVVAASASAVTTSGFYDVGPAAGGPSASDYLMMSTRHSNYGINYQFQLSAPIYQGGIVYARSIIGGTPSAWYILWGSAYQGPGTGMNADMVDGLHAASFAAAAHTHDYSAVFAAIGHGHSGVYQPAGSYSLTSHDHSGVYQAAGSYSVTGHTHTFQQSTLGGSYAGNNATPRDIGTTFTPGFVSITTNNAGSGVIQIINLMSAPGGASNFILSGNNGGTPTMTILSLCGIVSGGFRVSGAEVGNNSGATYTFTAFS